MFCSVQLFCVATLLYVLYENFAKDRRVCDASSSHVLSVWLATKAGLCVGGGGLVVAVALLAVVGTAAGLAGHGLVLLARLLEALLHAQLAQPLSLAVLAECPPPLLLALQHLLVDLTLLVIHAFL